MSPGDTFYVMFKCRSRRPEDVTVTSVGRIWANVDNRSYRIRISDQQVVERNFGVVGHAYRTKQEHDDSELLNSLWRKFASSINRGYRPPDGITAQHIKSAAELLGISLENRS